MEQRRKPDPPPGSAQYSPERTQRNKGYAEPPARSRSSSGRPAVSGSAGSGAYRSTARRTKRNMRAIARRRRAKDLLGACFCILAALAVTAALGRSYWSGEPVEVTASPEVSAAASESTAAPSPTSSPTPLPTTLPAETEYVQLADWRLVLVNDEVALPEDFVMTPRLYGEVQVHDQIYSELCALLDAAYSDGMVLWLASGYRSVETQERILNTAVQNRMRDGYSEEEAYANARLTIQAPGHSEHHTGLAVDFNYVSADFRDTEEYAWLQAHAAEYGFVERYPADKEEITGIDYEPWHFRYVGREHAEAMNRLGMCLEEYVQYCKEQG